MIDPVKYPNAFRFAPNNSQWDDANRHYITDVLKAKKVAVIGDNTGYGTSATAVSIENFKKAGIEVVYDAVIDDDRSRNAFGLLMSLNMLIETPGGFDYTGADCSGWMKEAGFRETRVEHLVGPDSMVVGIK